MTREPAIPGPPPEQEVEHLAGQCAILLRENRELRAEVERLTEANTRMAKGCEEMGDEIGKLKAALETIANMGTGERGRIARRALEHKPR
jgi:predicted RNase H-like nuclease (RuvC/YqgF family)